MHTAVHVLKLVFLPRHVLQCSHLKKFLISKIRLITSVTMVNFNKFGINPLSRMMFLRI